MWDLLLFFLLIVPLVHLIHEIGHVFVAKLFRVPGTEIGIGAGRKLYEGTVQGTIIRVNAIPFVGGYSTSEIGEELQEYKVALISLGGPIFNILSIMLVILFVKDTSYSLFHWFILFSCWIGLVNLIPFKIGSKKSDGWQICLSIIQSIKLMKTK